LREYGPLACSHVREENLRSALFALVAFGIVTSRFWLRTVRHSSLKPYPVYDDYLPNVAGGDRHWGPDQCKNDRHGTVDHDERLRITGVEPGRYDVKLADKIGRVCIVRNVEVKDGAVFSIEERQLTDCRR
jgi:hypothetical protein